MFAALASILGPNQTLDISITAGADGVMKVIVKPQLVKGSNAALALPLALSATPQELDADFVGTLMQYAGERTSLQQQVDVTTTILAEAKASEVGKATKSIKSSAKPSAKTDGGAGDNGDDDGDNNALDGDEILDNAPASTASTPTPSAPAVQQTSAPAANSNDDLLSLMM